MNWAESLSHYRRERVTYQGAYLGHLIAGVNQNKVGEELRKAEVIGRRGKHFLQLFLGLRRRVANLRLAVVRRRSRLHLIN